MKFLDLFSGIGGFRLGMEAAGHKCLGFCEIDKFARKSYKAIHNTKGEIELHDITAVSDDTIRKIRSVDIICGGFPCQAFSIAGNRRGFEDTRGTLFFEIARFASILRPKYLFLENVKGLLSHDRGTTFETILKTLDELGYNVEWQVLNSKNFGVPQNRERVFIIGHLRRESTRRIFPLEGNGSKIDIEQPKIKKVGNIRKKGKSQSGDVVSVDSLAPTLCSTTTQKDPLKILLNIVSGQSSSRPRPLTSNSYQENNVLKDTCNFRIRKLTPRECWRLQGFPDWAFDKAQEVNSNSQLYKQAGNSVTVNVITAIAKKL
ncbi:DNA cytosine methyltransferase [Streptococcus phage phiKSM96]|nr:DNA cytosine methyltransferase [Streptococcus mutans]WGL32758.1 DNA cytosine methyltransferase [Streptococcus phage phiKSM96]